MTTKIGVISDTHIPDRTQSLPMAVLEAFKNMDMVIHAGDFTDLSALEELAAVCKNIIVVRGNMDPSDVTSRFPEKEIVKVGKIKIGVMHGWGPPNKLIELMQQQFKNDTVDIIIFGHSHAAFNEKIDNVLYFNPGSPTDKVFAPYNSYGIIEINDRIEARIVRL